MTKFLSPLILTPDFVNGQWDGVNWLTYDRFGYIDEILGERWIPKGFRTDGGSIPRAFQNIISPLGEGVLGFVPHDWEYGTQTLSRADADALLVRILRSTSFDRCGIEIVYALLREAGEAAWDGDKPNIAANLKLLEAV